MINAVVFDLDNTLYDYDKCNLIAEERLFCLIAEEFDISKAQAQNLLKTAKLNIKYQLDEDVAASHNRLLYMQNICEQIGKNPLHYAMQFYNCYWDTMLENMELFDYVLPFVSELRAKGIKIGILTDLTAHIQYRKIKKLGLADYIDYLVTSEEAGAEKPSMRMFDRITDKLGLEPNEILMIGDSQKKDIEGAKNCGMQAMLFEGEKAFAKNVSEFDFT